MVARTRRGLPASLFLVVVTGWFWLSRSGAYHPKVLYKQGYGEAWAAKANGHENGGPLPLDTMSSKAFEIEEIHAIDMVSVTALISQF